jgi:hypothetical protein
MRESCVKPSNIIPEPSTIRPRYFYVKALLQPVKRLQRLESLLLLRSISFSGQSQSLGGLQAYEWSVYLQPSPLVGTSSLSFFGPVIITGSTITCAHISNIQVTLSYSDHLLQTVATTVSLLTQVPRSRSSSPTPHIPVKQLIAQEQHKHNRIKSWCGA